MRVLFLTHRLPYAPNRGDRIRAYHLLRTLAPHADIDLVSLVHDEEEASHATDLEPWLASVRVAHVGRVRNLLHAIPALATSVPMTHVMLDSVEVLPAIESGGAGRRPDVVFAYCSGMAKYIFSPVLRDVPCVIDMVDVDSSKWADLGREAWPPKQWIFRREAYWLAEFEARAAKHAFATLTVNERERQTLAALAPSARIESVPNGIDADFFKAPPHTERRADVVFVGVMNYAPNEQGVLWLAEHVWPKIRAARPDARLAIVGSQPTPAIQRLQESANGITVTGAVPDVRPYLWAASVAVAPLWVARGLQNKVLEAIAAGLPCVITPPVEGGLPEPVRSACTTARDGETFAAAILDLLGRSSTDRAALSASAQIETLKWEAQLAPVLGILQEAARSA